MGKSLRTFLVSYTSLYLRRSRTGRGFELPTDRASESSRTPASHPIASNSSSHPGQGEIGEPSRSLRDALKHYQTSPHFDAPKRPRCEDEHGPRHYRPFFYALIHRSEKKTATSPGRPATPLSDGPPRRGPRRAWPPAVPSGDRQGFGTVPSLLREARACSATPIAGTPPSGYHLSPVLDR